MTMAITPIIGTLAYILDQESDRVLLIRRDSRPDDDHFGKVHGLGGKVEKAVIQRRGAAGVDSQTATFGGL